MYRVIEKFSHLLVLQTSTKIIKFGCPKSKSSCPKSLARNSKTIRHFMFLITLFRGTQQEYSSKPLKHSIVKRILVFKQ